MVSGVPVYFELSWSILSSFSLLNVLAGFLIVGITGFTPLWSVPVLCSASSAIANGLCYIAYYSTAPLHARVPAAALADIFWCTQEAGLSFYSYIILRRFLRGKERLIHLSIFWFLMVTIVSLRMTILITRVNELLSGTDKQDLINHLHNGYFASIALVEVMSSYFLLNIFIKGKQSSNILSQGGSLFKQVIMSTEVRVSTLALIGIGRAITYSFQADIQSATSNATQMDRFLTTLESYFPIIMFLDLLATRLVSSEYSGATSSRSKYGAKSNNITMELNRINEDARQEEDRRTFVKIAPTTGDRSPKGWGDKGISKTTTISVDRGNEQTELAIEPVEAI